MIIGALIVVVLLFLYQQSYQQSYKKDGRRRRPPAPDCDSDSDDAEVSTFQNRYPLRPPMTVGAMARGRKSKSNFVAKKDEIDPYTKINKFIDAARGRRSSDLAVGSLPPWQVPGQLERYHQSGAQVKPEDLTAADQSQWVSGLDDSGAGEYDTERAFDGSNDATGYHEAAPVEYNEVLTTTVLGAREQDNHKTWVDSMLPWAGTAATVDTLDEAQEASVNFVGLRRPQPIAQYNALQVTENDTYTYLGNSKFNFLG